jgi:hypothetical protein
MEKREKKELTRMGKKMDCGLGIRLEKREKKELTRMGKKMDCGLGM